MNEMMAVEAELDIQKVKIPDFVTISIKDLAALDLFIEIIEIGGK